MQFFYPYSRGMTNIYAGDDIYGYKKGSQDCSKENALVFGIIYKGAQLTGHNFDLNIGSNMTSSVSFEVDTTPNAKPFRGVYMYDGNLLLTREEIELSSKDESRSLQIKSVDIEISNEEKKIKKYIPLSKRQDKPDSALWLLKQHNILKDSQIAKLVGITKNSVTSIRNKSYWNYNNLSPKDPVALNLFTQKDLIEAIEKAERRIKREKKEKEKQIK